MFCTSVYNMILCVRLAFGIVHSALISMMSWGSAQKTHVARDDDGSLNSAHYELSLFFQARKVARFKKHELMESVQEH